MHVVESACWDPQLDLPATDFSLSSKVGYVCHRAEKRTQETVCWRVGYHSKNCTTISPSGSEKQGGLAVFPDFLGADTPLWFQATIRHCRFLEIQSPALASWKTRAL